MQHNPLMEALLALHQQDQVPPEDRPRPAFPASLAEWHRLIHEFREHPCFKFYVEGQMLLERQKQEAYVFGVVSEVSGLVFREQCIGSVRGLRFLEEVLNADVKTIREEIQNAEKTTTEKPAAD